MLSEELLERLRKARHVVVMTGAGISAESGIPTFRDAQTGLWARFNPADLATPEAFLSNPQRVWDWYASRRAAMLEREPNAGHYSLVRMADLVPRLTLITQNVDGLHQRAGSRDVLELHGNLGRVKCFDYHHAVAHWDDQERPPHCPECGSLLRPDVVWFGEMLPNRIFAAAQIAAEDCDVFFSIGTSAEVYPAADLAHQALSAGAMVVEVNAERTPLSQHAHHVLTGKAGTWLPSLVTAAWGNEGDLG